MINFKAVVDLIGDLTADDTQTPTAINDQVLHSFKDKVDDILSGDYDYDEKEAELDPVVEAMVIHMLNQRYITEEQSHQLLSDKLDEDQYLEIAGNGEVYDIVDADDSDD